MVKKMRKWKKQKIYTKVHKVRASDSGKGGWLLRECA